MRQTEGHKKERMEGPRERRTDKASYRDARTHIKRMTDGHKKEPMEGRTERRKEGRKIYSDGKMERRQDRKKD